MKNAATNFTDGIPWNFTLISNIEIVPALWIYPKKFFNREKITISIKLFLKLQSPGVEGGQGGRMEVHSGKGRPKIWKIEWKKQCAAISPWAYMRAFTVPIIDEYPSRFYLNNDTFRRGLASVHLLDLGLTLVVRQLLNLFLYGLKPREKYLGRRKLYRIVGPCLLNTQMRNSTLAFSTPQPLNTLCGRYTVFCGRYTVFSIGEL